MKSLQRVASLLNEPSISPMLEVVGVSFQISRKAGQYVVLLTERTDLRF